MKLISVQSRGNRIARQLERELAEARAEIERLALLAQNQQIVIDAQSRSIQAKDALIEQMREALEYALTEARSTECERLIEAALSAAGRGE